MERSKFIEIVLSEWVPALITAVIGGIIVALIIPSVQTKYAENSVFKKRKIDLWESIGEDFTNYINARSRLNSAALEEDKHRIISKAMSRQFIDRKENYRAARDKYADQLRRDFLLGEFYYDKDVSALIQEYLKWQAQFRIATIDKLPPDEAYQKWREQIMIGIRSHLTKTYGRIP